jgi:hypothetical protein
MKDLAVILHTCDAYERLWDGWWYCWKKFQKNTDLDKVPLYFMNECISPSRADYLSDVEWRPTGVGEWSDRLIRGLANIPEPYVLYMQEDFWLDKTLTDTQLQEIMDWVTQGEAVRIMGEGKRLVESLLPPIKYEPLRRFAHRSPYFFGHAATVWYKHHLMRCLGPGEDPWRNCHEGNLRCWAMQPQPVHYHYPFEWYQEVHNNVKRTQAWKYANGDRSLPGEISTYGQRILKEMQTNSL